MSKAAKRSRSRSAVEWPASSGTKLSFWTCKRAVSQEWNLRYADWKFDIRLWEERWNKRWSAIISSVSLDKNDKFKMGRWFFKSFESRFDFFKSGLTKADLTSFGKEPVLRDKFTMHVSMGPMLPKQWDKRLEGMGSDWQVDFGEDDTSFLISSKNAGLNDENVGENLSGTEWGFTLINGRFKQSFIFFTEE